MRRFTPYKTAGFIHQRQTFKENQSKYNVLVNIYLHYDIILIKALKRPL